MKNSVSLNDKNNNNNKVTIFMKQYDYIFPKNNLNDWMEEIIIEKIDDILIKSFLGYQYYTPINKKENIPNKSKNYTTKNSKNIKNNNNNTILNNNNSKLKANPKNLNKFKILIFQRIFENGIFISGNEKNNNNELINKNNNKYFDVLNLDKPIENFYIENNNNFNNNNNMILNKNLLLENNKKLFDNEIIKTDRQNNLNIFYENKYNLNNYNKKTKFSNESLISENPKNNNLFYENKNIKNKIFSNDSLKFDNQENNKIFYDNNLNNNNKLKSNNKKLFFDENESLLTDKLKGNNLFFENKNNKYFSNLSTKLETNLFFLSNNNNKLIFDNNKLLKYNFDFVLNNNNSNNNNNSPSKNWNLSLIEEKLKDLNIISNSIKNNIINFENLKEKWNNNNLIEFNNFEILSNSNPNIFSNNLLKWKYTIKQENIKGFEILTYIKKALYQMDSYIYNINPSEEDIKYHHEKIINNYIKHNLYKYDYSNESFNFINNPLSTLDNSKKIITTLKAAGKKLPNNSSGDLIYNESLYGNVESNNDKDSFKDIINNYDYEEFEIPEKKDENYNKIIDDNFKIMDNKNEDDNYNNNVINNNSEDVYINNNENLKLKNNLKKDNKNNSYVIQNVDNYEFLMEEKFIEEPKNEIIFIIENPINEYFKKNSNIIKSIEKNDSQKLNSNSNSNNNKNSNINNNNNHILIEWSPKIESKKASVIESFINSSISKKNSQKNVLMSKKKRNNNDNDIQNLLRKSAHSTKKNEYLRDFITDKENF